MGLRFFVVPVHDSSPFEQELNGFLAGHKVVSIDRQLIDQGANSFWAICVDYLSHAPGEGASNPNLLRSRLDYKAILPPEDSSSSIHGSEKCARNWPRPKLFRSMRFSPPSSWRKWCSVTAVPRATWRKSRGSARAKSTSTRSGCCPWFPISSRSPRSRRYNAWTRPGPPSYHGAS